MTSAHGTLRTNGVDFDTDRRLSTKERAEARAALLAGTRRRASQVKIAAREQGITAAALQREQADRRDEEKRAVRLEREKWERIVSDDNLRHAALVADLLGTIDELDAAVAEADEDVTTLLSAAPDELAATVRAFLTMRHKKYPGVQQDMAAAVEKLATLSGWWLED